MQNLIFIGLVTIALNCSYAHSAATGTDERKTHEFGEELPLDSLFITLTDGQGPTSSRIEALLRGMVEMPEESADGWSEWRLALIKEVSNPIHAKRRCTRSRASVGLGNYEIGLNLTVIKRRYDSQFIHAEGLGEIFDLELRKRDYYYFRLYEYDPQSRDEMLVGELRVDSLGEIAELMNLNRGRFLPGKFYFDIMERIWRYLDVERVLLLDISKLELVEKKEKFAFPMRVYLPIAEGATLYQKLGQFMPLKCERFKTRKSASSSGFLPAQDPDVHGAAVRRLGSMPIADLLAVPQVPKRVVRTLSKKYLSAADEPNLGNLVKNMAEALRRKTPMAVRDFSALIAEILTPAHHASHQFHADLITIWECYVWILEQKARQEISDAS